MRYQLLKFKAIPQKAITKLSNFGIDDADQLLTQAALPNRRSALAEKTKLRVEDISLWAGMADLVRVKGIGPSTAELLVLSGAVGNVQSFVTAMSDPGLVLDKIKAFAKKTKKQFRIPSKALLASSAEEAAELRPKLLQNTSIVDVSFRDDVISREKAERRHSRRLSLSIIGFLVLAIGLLYGLSQIYLNHLIEGKIVPGNVLNQFSVDITRILVGISSSSLLVVVCILITSLVVLYVFYDWLTYLQNTWLVVWLFDHPQHRGFYRKTKSVDLKTQVRGIWLSVGVFAILAIGLVIYAFNLIQNRVEMDTFTEAISLPVIVGGVLIGITASLPILKFYTKEFTGKDNLGSVHRYMIFYMSKVLTLPLMVMLLTRLVMPVSFELHQKIYLDRLVPPARQQLLDKRQEIMRLDLKNPADGNLRNEILSMLDNELLPSLSTFGSVGSGQDNPVMDFYIPGALHMVVWTALTAFLLLFVLPYLILGGWKRGLFYILILGIGLNMEDLLTNYSPSWFSLPADSVSSLLLAYFFIFANALFFDWLFDELTDKSTICLSCGTSLPHDSFYCSNCGFAHS